MNFNSKSVVLAVVTVVTLVTGRELAARVSNPIPVALAGGAIVVSGATLLVKNKED